ncbi:MAG: hypothetical protein ACLP9L_10330, partial [Thermoguttaceae bacterium]
MFAKLTMRSSFLAARLSAVPFVGFVAVMLIASVQARADVTWTLPAGQSGDWSVASNWGGTLPTGSDNAWITDGGTATITVRGEVCSTLYLDGSALLMTTGGGLSPTNGEYVGYSGTATFTQSGGINRATSLFLAANAGSAGMYSLSGDGDLWATNLEIVGYFGTGTFTQTGGNNVCPLVVGYVMASGTYNLSGNGRLSASAEIIGYYSTGTFTQSGGTNLIAGSNELYLGVNAGSSGAYSLSGTGQVVASLDELVGCLGTGTFTQSGGANNISNYLYVGNNTGGSGTYNLSGSGQVSANCEYIGSSGTGTFTQSGGANNISNYLYLGNNTGGSGTYNLSGSGQVSAPYASESVGYSGTGTFTQTGGTNSLSYGSLFLGYNAGRSGAYNLS